MLVKGTRVSKKLKSRAKEKIFVFKNIRICKNFVGAHKAKPYRTFLSMERVEENSRKNLVPCQLETSCLKRETKLKQRT